MDSKSYQDYDSQTEVAPQSSPEERALEEVKHLVMLNKQLQEDVRDLREALESEKKKHDMFVTSLIQEAKALK